MGQVKLYSVYFCSEDCHYDKWLKDFYDKKEARQYVKKLVKEQPLKDGEHYAIEER